MVGVPLGLNSPSSVVQTFSYKQKEILNSGKSGKKVWTEAGYCIGALP